MKNLIDLKPNHMLTIYTYKFEDIWNKNIKSVSACFFYDPRLELAVDDERKCIIIYCDEYNIGTVYFDEYEIEDCEEVLKKQKEE